MSNAEAIDAPAEIAATDRSAALRDAAWARRSRESQFDPPGVGEHWAYRANLREPLAEVIVLRIGVKRPPRMFVRWVDDEFEGRQDWVSPGRLKCPWTELESFHAREQRWAALLDASITGDSPESSAADVVFEKLVDRRLAVIGWESSCMTVTILDVEGLTTFLGLEPDDLRVDPLSFIEEGALVAPWSIVLLIAARAAERDPEPVLREVAKLENEARDEALHGRYYEWRRQPPQHISAEACQEADAKRGAPLRATLRSWCGAEAVGRWDEAKALRDEVVRLNGLLDKAVEGLSRAGASRAAKVIERERRPPGGSTGSA